MNPSSLSDNPSRRRRRPVELLEGRRLLSGTWTTVDTVPPPAGSSNYIDSMAADSAGNVYAAGVNGVNGLLREKAAGSSSFADVATPAAGEFTSVATDPQGDVFLTDGGQILARPAGQNTFAPVNVTVPSGATWWLNGYQSFAADAAGDVFAIGGMRVPTGTVTTGHGANQKTTTTYTTYGALFEKAATQTSFSPVYQSTTFDPEGITLIDGSPSAGIYVIDDYSSGWLIRKSTNGGASWTNLPLYRYDSNISTYYTQADAIAGDSSGGGNLFVCGYGYQRVQTGTTYTKVKGQLVATPVYSYYEHWLTRQSSDGGATWSLDDFQQSPTGTNEAYAIADNSGTAYVVGYCTDGITRTNAGGAWHTTDDYAADALGAVAIDPTTAIPYTGAYDTWVIRADPGAAVTPPGGNLFSSPAGSRPVDDIFGG